MLKISKRLSHRNIFRIFVEYVYIKRGRNKRKETFPLGPLFKTVIRVTLSLIPLKVKVFSKVDSFKIRANFNSPGDESVL